MRADFSLITFIKKEVNEEEQIFYSWKIAKNENLLVGRHDLAVIVVETRVRTFLSKKEYLLTAATVNTRLLLWYSAWKAYLQPHLTIF